MEYDVVKDRLMDIISKHPGLMKVLFFILDRLFLRQWYVKKHIRKSFPRNVKIRFYDAGAGFCQYSDYILSVFTFSEVFALDLKSDYLANYARFAMKKYPGRFAWVQGDLVDYIPSGKYDIIAAVDILEHIDNDTQVLSNFYSCLNKGGMLIISTPSNIDETARFTAEHVRPGYSKDEIISKLVKAGFVLKKFEFSYGIFGNLSWKLAVKYPITIISYSKLCALPLAIYYLCLYPIIYLFMLFDFKINNKIGNGIIVVAEKPD